MALEILVQTLAAQTDARAVALTDDAGNVLAGVGSPDDLRLLAAETADGSATDDVYIRPVPLVGRTVHFASMGGRLRRTYQAAAAVSRILGLELD